jgi:hypothetical protein
MDAMKSVTPVFTPAQIGMQEVIERDEKRRPTMWGLILDFVVRGKRIPKSGIVVRLRLDDTERALIAAGGDLMVTQLTFGNPFMPFNIQIRKEGESTTYA